MIFVDFFLPIMMKSNITLTNIARLFAIIYSTNRMNFVMQEDSTRFTRSEHFLSFSFKVQTV